MARVFAPNGFSQVSGYGIAGAGFPATAYNAYAAPAYGGAATIVAPTYAAPVQAASPFVGSGLVGPRVDDVLGYGGYGVGVAPAGLSGGYLNSSLYGGRSIIPTAGYYGNVAGLGVPAYSSVAAGYGYNGGLINGNVAGLGVPAYSSVAAGYGGAVYNGGLINGLGAAGYINNAVPSYSAAYAPQYYGGYGAVAGSGFPVAQL